MTDGQWRAVFRRQRCSGLGILAFCDREGVAASTFFARRRVLEKAPERRSRKRRASRSHSAFVEVKRAMAGAETDRGGDVRDAGAARPTIEDDAIELTLARGVTVRVRPGFDAALLRRVVEVLT